MESVPAATLTLLLELGITPEELNVRGLSRERIVAWANSAPEQSDGPACAHIDTAALHRALFQRAATHPDITLARHGDRGAIAPGWVDATGRRSLSADSHIRPPRAWIAALVTFRFAGPDGLRLAAAHDGYAYRLGSAHCTTIGWVGPGSPPLTGAALQARIEESGTAWILGGSEIPSGITTFRRAASAALPLPSANAIPIGDAALTRDALASQGLSIGLSDACLVAEPTTTPLAMARRRADAIARHLRHLQGTVATCRHASAPCWSEYATWLRSAALLIADPNVEDLCQPIHRGGRT
jgi:hypothetical protein